MAAASQKSILTQWRSKIVANDFGPTTTTTATTANSARGRAASWDEGQITPVREPPSGWIRKSVFKSSSTSDLPDPRRPSLVDIVNKTRISRALDSFGKVVGALGGGRRNSRRESILRDLLGKTPGERRLSDGPGRMITDLGGRKRFSFGDVVSQMQQKADPSRRRLQMLWKLQNMKTKRSLLQKFRVAARVVLTCIQLSHAHILDNKEGDELSPFIKQLNFHGDFESLVGVELLFDPSKFKANRQTRISDEARRILCKRPEERTPQEIYSVQIALRNIKCFGDFPARMQRKIAEVGIYETYEAKRVVVRQGHPASSFYFILAGSVVVMVMDEARAYARPAAYLYKGQTFGELAIINRSPRQSSIIAKETCEFLSIDVQDYHRIFMAGGVKSITDPDHDSFVRSLPFLQGWPLQHLHQQPQKCLFLYFKRGDVLVKDSRFSSWIIVVKSGSVTILKKLRRVQPFEWKRGREFKFVSEKEKREITEKRTKWRRMMLPELRIPLRNSEGEDEAWFKEDGTPHPFQHPPDDVSALSTLSQSRFFSTQWRFGEAKTATGETTSKCVRLPAITPVATSQEEEDLEREESRDTVSELDYPASSRGVPADRPPDATNVRPKSISAGETKNLKKKKKRTAAQQRRRRSRRESVLEREREMMGFAQHVRTINEDLDAEIRLKDPDDVTAADINPEFVRVRTLTKGQCFGLTDLLLGQQTNFCLVSNGADCLLINKQFYFDNASEGLVRRMRQELCPYPTEEQLQESLQASVDWDAYRETTLASTLQQVSERKQFLKS